jgi:predicted transcriptional regulator
MAVRKRDSIKSYSRYLKSARAGGSKTRIVFQVNLNFRTVNHHIDVLTDGRLLEVLDVPVILYRTIIVGIHT